MYALQSAKLLESLLWHFVEVFPKRKLRHSNAKVIKNKFSVMRFSRKSSTQPSLPVLSSFSFMASHPSADMYAVFRVERMHMFLLESRMLLRTFLICKLNDPERTTYSIVTSQLKDTLFKQIEGLVQSQLNVLVRDT